MPPPISILRSAPKLVELYDGGNLEATIAQAAAEVDGLYDGKLNRVAETIVLTRWIGAKRIGFATCLGLIEAARVLVHILRLAGFEIRTVPCKVGPVDKTDIAETLQIKCGFEAACNSLPQARLHNSEAAHFNTV